MDAPVRLVCWTDGGVHPTGRPASAARLLDATLPAVRLDGRQSTGNTRQALVAGATNWRKSLGAVVVAARRLDWIGTWQRLGAVVRALEAANLCCAGYRLTVIVIATPLSDAIGPMVSVAK